MNAYVSNNPYQRALEGQQGGSPENLWYVFVQSRVYGPYNNAQMIQFVTEGRVTASSQISISANSGFRPAEDFEQFRYWSNIGIQDDGRLYSSNPATAPNNQPYTQKKRDTNTQPDNTQIANQTSNLFMIIAEISSDGEIEFLRRLQAFGQAQRIGDHNWLVRSCASMEQIRNNLSQALNRQDRLFVMDTKTGQALWFNIGADLDARIRQLFDEENLGTATK